MHGTLEGLMAVILISKAVTISGTPDERGEMTAIQGGEIPFAVEAPGAQVGIRSLRFIHPKRSAIFVDAAGGLTIESCAIEGVEAMAPLWNPVGITLGVGIHVSSLLGLPGPDRPGKPENVYGKLSIANNEISVRDGAASGVGIMIISVGDAEKPVDVDVSGNTIRNANQEGINVKYIGGRVQIESNVITTTAAYAGPARSPIAAIHGMGSGSYLIAHNKIDIADPNGAGIRVRGYSDSAVSIKRTITDNDVTMSAPEGAVFGPGSVGIDVRGFPEDNVVTGNRVRGRARVAVCLSPECRAGGLSR
jgi:hypothetical protein